MVLVQGGIKYLVGLLDLFKKKLSGRAAAMNRQAFACFIELTVQSSEVMEMQIKNDTLKLPISKSISEIDTDVFLIQTHQRNLDN